MEESFDDIINLFENNLELIYNAHPEYKRIYLSIENIKGDKSLYFRLKFYESRLTISGYSGSNHIFSSTSSKIFRDKLHAYIQLCKSKINFRNVGI